MSDKRIFHAVHLQFRRHYITRIIGNVNRQLVSSRFARVGIIDDNFHRNVLVIEKTHGDVEFYRHPVGEQQQAFPFRHTSCRHGSITLLQYQRIDIDLNLDHRRDYTHVADRLHLNIDVSSRFLFTSRCVYTWVIVSVSLPKEYTRTALTRGTGGPAIILPNDAETSTLTITGTSLPG